MAPGQVKAVNAMVYPGGGIWLLRMVGLALATFFLWQPSHASAQVGNYDANCNPVIPDPKFYPLTPEEILKTHPAGWVATQVVNGGCKAVNLVRNLTKTLETKPNLTADDYYDASEPKIELPSKFQRLVEKAKQASGWGAPDSERTGELVRDDDGTLKYTETVKKNGIAIGGTSFSTSGTYVRGGMKNGKFEGDGEILAANGAIYAGNLKDGQPNGAGALATVTGDSVVLVEGTFDGLTPVGEVIVTLADGSRRRELWADGKKIATGQLASPGGIPPDLVDPRIALNAAPQPGVQKAAARAEGWEIYQGSDGRKRYELWCGGKLMKVDAWYPLGDTPIGPQYAREIYEQMCEGKEAEETDEAEEPDPSAGRRSGILADGSDGTRVEPAAKGEHPWIAGIIEATLRDRFYDPDLSIAEMHIVLNQCSYSFEEDFRDSQLWYSQKGQSYSMQQWYDQTANKLLSVYQWERWQMEKHRDDLAADRKAIKPNSRPYARECFYTAIIDFGIK